MINGRRSTGGSGGDGSVDAADDDMSGNDDSNKVKLDQLGRSKLKRKKKNGMSNLNQLLKLVSLVVTFSFWPALILSNSLLTTF